MSRSRPEPNAGDDEPGCPRLAPADDTLRALVSELGLADAARRAEREEARARALGLAAARTAALEEGRWCIADLRGETLLFLDVDGVLHPTPSADEWAGRASCGGCRHFRPSCCAQLARVVAATRCLVVLSSAWRLDGEARRRVQQALRPHLGAGFELAGLTLEFDGHGARAREILEFVEASGCDAQRWVALDDEDLVGGGGGAAAAGAGEEDDHFSHFGSAATSARMAPHAVRTDAVTGMTSGDADRCIAVLLAGNTGS